MEKKYIGIWMDHASANLMEMIGSEMKIKTINSKFTHEEKKETLHKGEKAMHHKEQHEESAYYKEIAAVIESYDEVLIFGPTEAKTELVNVLKTDHHFDNKKIESMQADRMTENQQHAFVKKYFFAH
ncbi:hypothetical protein [[Flexibacter] sp. ATCC 35208]|uniref:hypothetical protein n=1 Tax=[Flexibacter] sp. ATCC 35208 TaxID=1936242 RepID=UPI0009CEDEB5|nr:hypothetical protein [[Flexibacter] sp. ATCC 35208]OMP77676.1 hypothetical protein BW716_18215 [[Flexibacter] sp. ATCC 35208]